MASVGVVAIESPARREVGPLTGPECSAEALRKADSLQAKSSLSLHGASSGDAGAPRHKRARRCSSPFAVMRTQRCYHASLVLHHPWLSLQKQWEWCPLSVVELKPCQLWWLHWHRVDLVNTARFCMQGRCSTGMGLVGSEWEQGAAHRPGFCQRCGAVWADASLRGLPSHNSDHHSSRCVPGRCCGALCQQPSRRSGGELAEVLHRLNQQHACCHHAAKRPVSNTICNKSESW